MWELVVKIWFFIVILPITIAQEGYKILKKFLARHGYEADWAYTTLAVLVVLLIVALILKYGYR